MWTINCGGCGETIRSSKEPGLKADIACKCGHTTSYDPNAVVDEPEVAEEEEVPEEPEESPAIFKRKRRK